jgi:hypothetical protein
MDRSKTIILTCAGIIAFGLMLLVIQALLRKLKPGSEQDGRIKVSYGVWVTALLIAASTILVKTINLLLEAMDTIYKSESKSPLMEIGKTGSLFIGLAIAWFLICYAVSNIFPVLIVGKRKSQNEIETDNVSYFLVNGVILIGLNFCLLPVFEMVIRMFMPSISLPFYH